jgi:flagellin
MSISFQTNIASMIAAVNLNNNNNFQTNTIEQLTSGYRINNSGDDAAGLAVANGYAANVAELTQGVLNGNQGVNTLQIIDGGLSNISTMLNRMQTLATESATTTFTGNRATLNDEYQTLVGEINREASNIGLGGTNATNANNLSVYIGGGAGAATGSTVSVNLSSGLVDSAALGLANTSVLNTTPVTIGGAPAVTIAPAATEVFTVNTASGTSTFTLTGQANDTVASQLQELNAQLSTVGISASLDKNGDLAFTSGSAFNIAIANVGLAAGGETGNNTSLNTQGLAVAAAGTFRVTEGSITANISLGTPASDAASVTSINAQLQAAGITDLQAVDTSAGGGALSLQGASTFTVSGASGGITPAGYTAATALSVAGPTAAINAVTAAVQLLGQVQGAVGAGENDLNYAIGLANSQITNFSATESSIRDADVATEAANLTKAQVLEQASVAAMAQANSAPQVILSLLKSA